MASLLVGNHNARREPRPPTIFISFSFLTSFLYLSPRHVDSGHLAVRSWTGSCDIHRLLVVAMLVTKRRVIEITAVRLRLDHDFVFRNVVLVGKSICLRGQPVRDQQQTEDEHDTPHKQIGECSPKFFPGLPLPLRILSIRSIRGLDGGATHPSTNIAFRRLAGKRTNRSTIPAG
jgi:hypothetical protein